MKCIPENDLHTEECIKGMAPCDGFRCSVCGVMLSGDLQSSPNPTMCHECADGYAGAAYREMDAVRSSVNYSEPPADVQSFWVHEPTGETIDITPVGMTTIEGIQRVRNAQQEWDSATHLLANTLKELLEDYVYGEGFSGDELHQLKALIGARDRKQEAFLRAVAGR